MQNALSLTNTYSRATNITTKVATKHRHNSGVRIVDYNTYIQLNTQSINCKTYQNIVVVTMEGSRKRATDGKVDGGKEGGHSKDNKSRNQHEHVLNKAEAASDSGELTIYRRVNVTSDNIRGPTDMVGAGAAPTKASDTIIDRLIDDSETKCRDHADAITHRLNDVCQLSRDYIDRIMSVDKAKKGRDLIPLLKEAETFIAECKASTSGIPHQCNVEPCLFVGNKTLLDHLKIAGAIETIPCLSEEINIRGPTDKKTCHVTGLLVLADGRLLLSDYNNRNIKLFDDNHTLVSHVPLQSGPTDIAETAGGQVAVCLPVKSKIQFLSVSGTLTPGTVIETAVKCWSVTRCGDNLAAVDNSSPDIVEIDMRGRKVTTVWTCPYGDLLCIRHNTRGELIMTDSGRACDGGVTRVSRHGVVLARYKDFILAPRGLTIFPGGSIYVCDYTFHNIHHITADCTSNIEIFGDGQILHTPDIICYKKPNSLYVSQAANDCINVFRLGY